MNYCRRFLKYFFLSKKMHLKDPKVENYQSLGYYTSSLSCCFSVPRVPSAEAQEHPLLLLTFLREFAWKHAHTRVQHHTADGRKPAATVLAKQCALLTWPPNMKWYFPPILTVVKVNIINLAINHILLFVTSSTFCILVIKLTKYFTCLGLNYIIHMYLFILFPKHSKKGWVLYRIRFHPVTLICFQDLSFTLHLDVRLLLNPS